MTNQVLAETVKRVLMHPAIARVNFQLYGLLVTGNTYLSMLNMYSTGLVSCEVGVPPNPDLPDGVVRECLYVPEHHRMHFRYEQYGTTSNFEKFNIVHEATHALFDARFGTKDGHQILAVEDEAAAWFAQAVYFRASGLLWDGGMLIEGQPGEPLVEALKLRDKLVKDSGAFGLDGRICMVSAADAIGLRQSAAAQHKLVGGRSEIKSVYKGFS